MSSITELFAYLTTANDVEEIAVYEVLGQTRLLIALDHRRALGMHPMAQTVADESRSRLHLVRFTTVEELDVVEPV